MMSWSWHSQLRILKRCLIKGRGISASISRQITQLMTPANITRTIKRRITNRMGRRHPSHRGIRWNRTNVSRFLGFPYSLASQGPIKNQLRQIATKVKDENFSFRGSSRGSVRSKKIEMSFYNRWKHKSKNPIVVNKKVRKYSDNE